MKGTSLIFILVLITTSSSVPQQEIFELTTGLDHPRVRFFFHQFRDFVFNTIGKTSRKTRGSFLQQKFADDVPFPCDISIGKSRELPKSVHKLRPGGNLIGMWM